MLGFNSQAQPNLHQFSPASGNTAVISLTGGGLVGGQTVTYFGLPVIGFAAETFQNDAITIGGKTFLSTFGATFPHHLGRVIGGAP